MKNMLIIQTEVWRSNNVANNKKVLPISDITSTVGVGSLRKLVCKNIVFLYFIFLEIVSVYYIRLKWMNEVLEIVLVICCAKSLNGKTDCKVLSILFMFSKLTYKILILMAKEVYNESYQKTVEFNSVIFV